MRYDASHKAKSRALILEAARRQFRRHGFEDASIDRIMASAGLTRGAFYVHFRSKEHLIEEVMAIESGLVRAVLAAAAADDPRAALLSALSHYLDPSQRADVASGCPLVAHPVDAIRGGGSRQRGYTERLAALIMALASGLGAAEAQDAAPERRGGAGPEPDEAQHPGVGQGEARLDALTIAILAVGGGLMSAACDDRGLADEIGSAALRRITDLLEGSSKPKHGSHR